MGFDLDSSLPSIYNVKRSSRDSRNRKHIARHAITPEEAEEAALIEPLEAAVQQNKNEERVLCLGRAKSGRLRTILYAEWRGKIRVVTAYEMTKEQKQLYFEGK